MESCRVNVPARPDQSFHHLFNSNDGNHNKSDPQVNLDDDQLRDVLSDDAVRRLHALPRRLFGAATGRADSESDSDSDDDDDDDDDVDDDADDDDDDDDDAFAFSRVGCFVRRYTAAERTHMPFHVDGNAFTANVRVVGKSIRWCIEPRSCHGNTGHGNAGPPPAMAMAEHQP